MMLVGGLVGGGLLLLLTLAVMSMRKVPVALPSTTLAGEGPSQRRVLEALLRIVPDSRRVPFEAEAYADLSSFLTAALTLCGPEGSSFVAGPTDGRPEAPSLSVGKHTFRTPPAPNEGVVPVGLATAEQVLGLINQALKVTRSAKRMALLFDQKRHWLAMLEPGFASRLQRVGVRVWLPSP